MTNGPAPNGPNRLVAAFRQGGIRAARRSDSLGPASAPALKTRFRIGKHGFPIPKRGKYVDGSGTGPQPDRGRPTLPAFVRSPMRRRYSLFEPPSSRQGGVNNA